MLQRTVVVLLVAIGLAGCASVPMGDTSRDAELKSFSSKPGVAGLFIYRNESFGAAIRMDVEVDGKPVGQTAAKTYFYKEVAPGKHTITSKSENTDSIEVDTVALQDALFAFFLADQRQLGTRVEQPHFHLLPDVIKLSGHGIHLDAVGVFRLRGN